MSAILSNASRYAAHHRRYAGLTNYMQAGIFLINKSTCFTARNLQLVSWSITGAYAI